MEDVASSKICPGSSSICFPDPDPDGSTDIRVDDVTRMNTTAVAGVIYVRSADDIKRALAKAKTAGRRVAVRGTKHSMGGQSMAEDSIVIDMTQMTKMHFDRTSETIVCECGCTWADLILYLNQFGMSPRTMQSYSTFSVGGTLAVNGHGITTDFSLSECVESFRLIKADGEDVTCSRGEAAELFKLALGGYGLFGIMWEVTMRVEPNSRMDMEALHLKSEEFVRYHAAARNSEDVVMKLARLNILDTDCIDFFVFRRSHDKEIKLVSKLERKPREMSWQSKLMYKWLMPVMKEVRYAIEKRSGTALDWGNETERNHMLHESAVPIAQLYEPLFHMDDTFVLQEYFCPSYQFQAWINRTKTIYQRLAATTEIILLNTTIRFVEKDVDTFLPYAKHEEGMFAFVLYYRLPRTASADAKLQEFHHLFVEATLALKGSFYLPYRCHYTHEELEQAYPEVQEFFAKKEIYDPTGLFDNSWFRHYGTKYLSESYRSSLSCPLATSVPLSTSSSMQIEVPQVPTRRCNAFRDLLASPLLRRDFKDGFLTQIFNVMDNEQLFRMMVKAARDPENRDDIEIYRALQRQLGESNGPVAAGMKMWKQLNQLSSQKKELTREVCSIVAHLGKSGQLHDYLSIGDAGRLVLPLRRALGMKGKCWIAHDEFSDDVPAVVERGSLDCVGIQVNWHLIQAGPFLEVPDASADLVTIMQGLHHIPQQHLPQFLTEVVRVLRPGGLFIFREHDASPSLMPLLDLAHSVFNAVMGVTDKEEEQELRAFRPLSEWRKILETTGLEDSMLFEMEAHDPTQDEMMCFFKPPLKSEIQSLVVEKLDPLEPIKEEATLQLPETFMNFLETAPKVLQQGILDAIDGLQETLPAAVGIFKERMKAFSSGQQVVAQSLVDQAAEPILKILQKLRPLLEQVELKGGAGGHSSSLENLLPAEVFLLVPALMRKVQTGKASANEMFAAAILKDILDALQGQKVEDQKKTQEVTTVAVTKQEVEALLETVLQMFPQLSEANAIEAMGFPTRATQVLLSQLGNRVGSVGDVAQLLATYLDEEAWIEFRAALVEAIHDGEPPSATAVLRRPQSHWARAFRAFLGSQHVQLKHQALMMCNCVGLGELPPLWHAAQASRKSQHPQQFENSGVVSPAPVRSPADAEKKRSLQRALDGLTPQLQEVVMEEGRQHDIRHVAEVASASFGYTSLTAKPQDVTQQVKQMLQQGRLRLQNVNLCRAFGLGGPADGLRRVATGNTRKLTIHYRSNCVLPPEDLLPRITTLLERLQSNGWTERRHANDGEYTWYKLNEWMQVEILQIFGQSLENEPWYRFPYFQFMKVYFDVLFQESTIVQNKLGLKKAFGSMAFITSLVPGLIMLLLFAQMKLLATPLLALPTSLGFGESYDEDVAREQLVVLRPRDAPNVDWKRIDERMIDIVCPVQGLYIMKVPTFKVLTDICKTLAQDENMTILEISSQKQVQMKVSARGNDSGLSRELSSLPGCEVVTCFSYPTDGVPGPASTQWALCIHVPYLLSTIRACDYRGIRVEQVYDFYC